MYSNAQLLLAKNLVFRAKVLGLISFIFMIFGGLFFVYSIFIGYSINYMLSSIGLIWAAFLFKAIESKFWRQVGVMFEYWSSINGEGK